MSRKGRGGRRKSGSSTSRRQARSARERSAHEKSSTLATAVEAALALLEDEQSIGEAIAKTARQFEHSPRCIWSALRQESAYRIWLHRQDGAILETMDQWSDRVAQIILSSSSDHEIDDRILALCPDIAPES